MKKLIKNISWIFSGNIIAAFTKWFVLILIARLLTPYEVGTYSLAFALTAPITLFFNLKLRSLIVTEKDLNFSDYVFTRNLMSVFALILITLFGIILYPEYLIIIILVGVNKIYDLHSEVYYSIPQIHGNFDMIGKFMIIKHLILLIIFALTLYLSNNLMLSLIMQIIAQIVIFYLIEKSYTEKFFSIKHSRVYSKSIRKIILLGIPLGFSAMMISLNSNFPRYILEYFETPEILGYFSAIAYILTIGNLIMNSVTQNFLPMLTKQIKKRNYKLFKKQVFIQLTSISLILGIITVLFSYIFGELFLTLVYGSDYAEYVDILILMGWGMAINFISWNYDTALMSMRYISIQPKISIVTVMISIVTGFFFIKEYGIYGATYTIIITNFVQLILRGMFVLYGLNKKQM